MWYQISKTLTTTLKLFQVLLNFLITHKNIFNHFLCFFLKIYFFFYKKNFFFYFFISFLINYFSIKITLKIAFYSIIHPLSSLFCFFDHLIFKNKIIGIFWIFWVFCDFIKFRWYTTYRNKYWLVMQYFRRWTIGNYPNGID